MDEDESKRIIVNKNLSQRCYRAKVELCSTEEDKSECTITTQKCAKNEVTYDVPNYFNAFNVFKCRRNILDRIDVSCEKAYMATPEEEYFLVVLDHLNELNRRHDRPLSSKKLQQTVIRVVEE